MIGTLLTTGELPSLPIDEKQRRLAVARALTREAAYDLAGGVFARVDGADRPDAVAVRDPDTTTSYRELALLTRRIAAALVEHGVGGGTVVAVGGPRGVQIVAALLATELIGAVYLPVDHTWPPLRLRDVLHRAGAALLLHSGARPPAGSDVETLSLVEAARRPPLPHPSRPTPDQPRYVLFTSGSTGLPKGAVVEHQGMMNHLHAKVDDLALTGADRVAQTAPLVFDISLWQMLAPLLVGAEVHVLPDDQAHDAERLLDTVVRERITVLEVVPTILRLLLDEVDRNGAAPPSLRWLLATGEELPPATARRCARSWPGVRLLNAYGPTECSDDVTHCEVGSPGPDVAHLPIGLPIANTALYVLRYDGARWSSCGQGEVGELFVGGVGVGRGYLGDPERTREAFFQDPFADTATGRLYRTGDAVVVTDDGLLEYRGRVDRQVKIAGFRMELSEIEAVLGTHPAVAACAVAVLQTDAEGSLVARETKLDGATGHRLIAYLCPHGDDLDEFDVRDHLAQRLPLPMVPQRFVVLPALPLTPNGKVDYALLATGTPVPGTTFVTPQGEREELVAAAMAELLGAERVGRDDSFVVLGGDSLLAVRLIARLRDDGYLASLRDVLLGGTPRGLAERLDAVGEVPRPTVAPSVPEVRRRPLTPQQSGVYFHWRLAPDNPYYSYQGSLRLVGPLDVGRLSTAWQTLLHENPILLARFVDDDAGPVHEFPHWAVPLDGLTDLTTLPAHERDERFRDAAFAVAAEPFDLRAAPALRVHLFRLAPGEHRLLVTMHEILLDGWGATILFGRLAELYDSPTTPGDALRYDRYLDWQERALADGGLDRARRYWRDQLAGPLPVLELPNPDRRPAHPSYRGEIVEAVVDAATHARMRDLAGRIGGTPFMIMLGAYALALGYYAGSDEIVVGAPIANREHAEQTEVVAFLINMLPLRITLDPTYTAREYLLAVRDRVVAGYAAAAYPFGWMLRDLTTVDRSTAHTPVFQTMLNQLTYPVRPAQAAGVTFAFTELDTGFTKYDCSLYVQAHPADTLLVQLAHHVDVVAADTARRLLESTLLALDALVRTPQTPVAEIDLLPLADRALLEEFSHGT
ncbi:amino acid adenylation domain-containing protein [Micromonospora sp. HUAS LYJ1]|uniref:amino acid adenylation domain-containing protein n=1 Tax=Micromonospora sp. HUAS LYJ1 TaxID=3061626 RepID=UPI0026710785|nr:amino acid adenylation domain-containing protein [Micromonospora sp. HUAS LYJ1]WKU02941.1 amino acid adenylation domain-containing protein [Micromonospora sp. HUAS LYJ1]